MEFRRGENTLFYEVHGEGHPLIILHAMGTDHRSMKAWMEPIDLDGFMRVYVDIPRHGRSCCKSINSTEEMVEFLLQFIDQLFPNQPFALIGHSFGGYVAQGILKAKREKVTGIGLIASALHIKNRNVPPKLAMEVDEASLASIDPDIRNAFETLMVYQNNQNLEAFLQEIQPGRLLADKDFLMSNWRESGYFYSEDPFKDLITLEQPALFITGKQDAICGYKDYFFLLDLFQNSTYAVLDQAGHLMTIEKRKTVQALVSEWLESIPNKKKLVVK